MRKICILSNSRIIVTSNQIELKEQLKYELIELIRQGILFFSVNFETDNDIDIFSEVAKQVLTNNNYPPIILLFSNSKIMLNQKLTENKIIIQTDDIIYIRGFVKLVPIKRKYPVICSMYINKSIIAHATGYGKKSNEHMLAASKSEGYYI